MPLILTFVVIAVVLLAQGLVFSAERYIDHEPEHAAIIAAAVVVALVFAFWGWRSRSRKPVLLWLPLVAVVVGTLGTYNTNGGYGFFGVNSARHIYQRTGLAFGSFADRLAAGAATEIERADFCAAAVAGTAAPSKRADGCRRVFANGVNADAVRRLKEAAAERDWQAVEEARYELGDTLDYRRELWRL